MMFAIKRKKMHFYLLLPHTHSAVSNLPQTLLICSPCPWMGQPRTALFPFYRFSSSTLLKALSCFSAHCKNFVLRKDPKIWDWIKMMWYAACQRFDFFLLSVHTIQQQHNVYFDGSPFLFPFTWRMTSPDPLYPLTRFILCLCLESGLLHI